MEPNSDPIDPLIVHHKKNKIFVKSLTRPCDNKHVLPWPWSRRAYSAGWAGHPPGAGGPLGGPEPCRTPPHCTRAAGYRAGCRTAQTQWCRQQGLDIFFFKPGNKSHRWQPVGSVSEPHSSCVPMRIQVQEIGHKKSMTKECAMKMKCTKKCWA